MRKILLLLVLAVCIFALDDVTVPNTFSDGTIIYADDVNANYDTLEAWVSRNNDSVETKFSRFTDFPDSTLQRINVDTIRGNPHVDSLQGYIHLDSIFGFPHIDSIETHYLIATEIIGNTTLDSIDATYVTADTLVSQYIDLSNGNIDGTIIGASVATTGTFSTLNTGLGAGELYNMDQHVTTTSDVTFGVITSDTLKTAVVDSLTFSASSKTITTFDYGEFDAYITTSDFTVQDTFTIKYSVIGGGNNLVVTYFIPEITGTSNSNAFNVYPISPPASIGTFTGAGVFVPVLMKNNSKTIPGMILIDGDHSNYVVYSQTELTTANSIDLGNFRTSGTKGFIAQSITFRTDE